MEGLGDFLKLLQEVCSSTRAPDLIAQALNPWTSQETRTLLEQNWNNTVRSAREELVIKEPILGGMLVREDDISPGVQDCSWQVPPSVSGSPGPPLVQGWGSQNVDAFQHDDICDIRALAGICELCG